MKELKRGMTIGELLDCMENYIYFNGNGQLVTDPYFQKLFEQAGGNFGLLLLCCTDNVGILGEIKHNLARVDYKRSKKNL